LVCRTGGPPRQKLKEVKRFTLYSGRVGKEWNEGSEGQSHKEDGEAGSGTG